MKKLAMFLMAVVLCASALAQEKPAAKKPAAAPAKEAEKKPAEKKAAAGQEAMGMMPKPAPEMEKLSKLLVGTWSTSEKHEPSPWMPKGGTGKGTGVYKRGPGGLSLIEEYKSSNAMGGFEGHGVIWWDAKAQGYKSIWCDNGTPQGCEVSNGLGKWVGSDVTFAEESEMMGKKMALKGAYTEIKPDSFTFSMDGGPPGGELKRMMTIKYTRAGGAKAKPEAAKKP